MLLGREATNQQINKFVCVCVCVCVVVSSVLCVLRVLRAIARNVMGLSCLWVCVDSCSKTCVVVMFMGVC